MKSKEILKVIGEGLLLAVMIAIFGCLSSALGVGALILVGLIGEWVGMGNKIFICIVSIIFTWKAWDVLVWVIDKITKRVERKKNQCLESK